MLDIPIDDEATALPVYTFLIHGDTRSGKTEFAATFPRPLVFADVVESGYRTIRSMDRTKWFEPGVAPIIKGIQTPNDIAAFLPELDNMIASNTVMTVVFDALSFYTDFFLQKLIESMAKPDMRQAYGSLGIHLRKLRSDLHSRGVNVVWNTLCKHPDQDDPKGRPMVPGQQGDKFSAGVDFLMHSRIEQKREGGKIVSTEHQLRTQQYGAYICGNRLGALADRLPDPFSGTYADFIGYLGSDVDALRAAMPKAGAYKPGTTIAGPGVKAGPPARPVAKAPPKLPAGMVIKTIGK